MVAVGVEKPTEEYISIRRSAKELGICVGTMYRYVKTLGMHTKTYPRDKRIYLLVSELEKARSLRDAKKQRKGEEDIPNYISFPAAARELGITAQGVQYYVSVFKIPTEKFPRTTRLYLLRADFEKIKGHREARSRRLAAEKA